MLVVTVLTVLAVMGTGQTEEIAPEQKKAKVQKCKYARQAVSYYRFRTHANQAARQAQRLARKAPVARGKTCRWARYAAETWQARAYAARQRYEQWREQVARERRELYAKWECIHENEGRWDDPNPPYWGGLQMSLWFQQTYGSEFYARWGTADRWPVWAQLTAAERAYQSDGDYGQWPNTARECGLPT